MKQARQAVRDVKQSIFLRCLWAHAPEILNDTTTFGQKSIGRMIFSRLIMITSVGQNALTSNINVNGIGCFKK